MTLNKDVIGYAMAEHIRAQLVTGALEMAARNHQLEEDCIMPFDRGCQIYVWRIFRHLRRARAAAIGGPHPDIVGIMRWRNRFSPV